MQEKSPNFRPRTSFNQKLQIKMNWIPAIYKSLDCFRQINWTQLVREQKTCKLISIKKILRAEYVSILNTTQHLSFGLSNQSVCEHIHSFQIRIQRCEWKDLCVYFDNTFELHLLPNPTQWNNYRDVFSPRHYANLMFNSQRLIF